MFYLMTFLLIGYNCVGFTWLLQTTVAIITMIVFDLELILESFRNKYVSFYFICTLTYVAPIVIFQLWKTPFHYQTNEYFISLSYHNNKKLFHAGTRTQYVAILFHTYSLYWMDVSWNSSVEGVWSILCAIHRFSFYPLLSFEEKKKVMKRQKTNIDMILHVLQCNDHELIQYLLHSLYIVPMKEDVFSFEHYSVTSMTVLLPYYKHHIPNDYCPFSIDTAEYIYLNSSRPCRKIKERLKQRNPFILKETEPLVEYFPSDLLSLIQSYLLY